jgi:hypothetical protein
MLYKCISLKKAVIPADAKQHAGETYFQAQYLPVDNDTDIKVVKINIFPTTPEVMAIYQEKVDNNQLLKNKEFERIYVELPAYIMKDDATKTWRVDPSTDQAKVYNGMEVCVEMKKNLQFIAGKTPEWLTVGDPKAKAEQTINRLGKFIAKAVHTDHTPIAESEAAAAPAVVVPLM